VGRMIDSRVIEIAGAYSKFAPFYDALMEKSYQKFYRERIKRILRSYITKGSKILDIGCGTGFPSIFLAEELGCRVLGIDVSEEMINRAKENIPQKLKNNLSFRLLSADELYLLGEKDFNYVTSIYGSLNYVEDLENVLREIYNHMERGGYLIASFYSKYSYARLRDEEHLQHLSKGIRLFPHYIGNEKIESKLYSMRELLSLIEKYFSPISIQGVGFVPFMLSLEKSQELIKNLDYYLELEENLASKDPFVNLGMDILTIGKKVD
jgi:ubiquinone/menaquinone biosynthesis C-methylase UbiE